MVIVCEGNLDVSDFIFVQRFHLLTDLNLLPVFIVFQILCCSCSAYNTVSTHVTNYFINLESFRASCTSQSNKIISELLTIMRYLLKEERKRESKLCLIQPALNSPKMNAAVHFDFHSSILHSFLYDFITQPEINISKIENFYFLVEYN